MRVARICHFGALAGSVAALFAGIAAAQEPPRLSLPIQCDPGKTCFIQNYVDADPGPDARDFMCGTGSYDGHKGTDFRVLSAEAARKGVDVLASADGTVKGKRDGVEDGFVTNESRAAVSGRECGNGVVIDHGGGWETQYCHMLKGSVSVKTGDQVKRGAKLGSVGYSGFVEFAHVHFEVRKDGQPIDPYSGRAQSEACSPQTDTARGLWDAGAAGAFKYADAEILSAGFTGDPKATELQETAEPPQPVRSSPALLFYMRAANLRAGDQIKLLLEGPQGVIVESAAPPLERPKAVVRPFAGKKLTAAEWPAGLYKGVAVILRSGQVISERRVELDLK